MSKRRFRTAWRCSAIVLAAAVIVPAASGIAAVTRPSTVSPKLVGKWTRTISKADATRAGGLLLAAGKPVTFTVAKNGHWTVVIAGLGGLGAVDGAVTSAGRDQRRFMNSGEPAALYRWRVAANKLTLTKIRDTVPDRQTVFWGVWKRT
jgi:hypothetical protein